MIMTFPFSIPFLVVGFQIFIYTANRKDLPVDNPVDQVSNLVTAVKHRKSEKSTY